MGESTLALALVIPDYRPDMLNLLQRLGQFWLETGKKRERLDFEDEWERGIWGT